MIFGTDRIRQKFSKATEEAVQTIQEIHRVVKINEQISQDSIRHLAQDKQVRVQLAEQITKLQNILNQMDSSLADKQETMEFIIDGVLDAERLKERYYRFKQHYDSSVSMVLALMNEDYLLSMVLRDDDIIDKILEGIGESRIMKYLEE